MSFQWSVQTETNHTWTKLLNMLGVWLKQKGTQPESEHLQTEKPGKSANGFKKEMGGRTPPWPNPKTHQKPSTTTPHHLHHTNKSWKSEMLPSSALNQVRKESKRQQTCFFLALQLRELSPAPDSIQYYTHQTCFHMEQRDFTLLRQKTLTYRLLQPR